MMDRILIDLPEIIETPRLKLQVPKVGFGERLYPAILDGYEDYIKWLRWAPKIPTLEEIEKDCRKHYAEFILRELIRYIIIDKSTGVVVGRCAFPPIQAHWSIPQFGIAYFIRKTHRGKGFATESAHVMALIAFKLLMAKKVEIFCDAENVESNKVPQKLNFKLEYTQRGGWTQPDGELSLLNCYSIFSLDNLPKLKVKYS